MATAPTVPNFAQFNFEIGDTAQVVVKQNGVNNALLQFGNSLTAMTDSINTDLQTMEGQKTDTQAAAQAASEDAEQVALDKQAVASDRAHVDQQKGVVDTKTLEVSNNAQQVALDRQAVAEDRLASEQAAGASSNAATASIQAKDDAQALYGDLNAVETAKTQAQQAATNAGEERVLAETARTGAETAKTASEQAASTSQQAATDAVTAHVDDLDPHTQYEKKVALKAGAYRETVGGDGPVMVKGFAGLGAEQAPRTTNKNPDDTSVTGFYHGRSGLHADADLGDNPFPAATGGYYLMVIADTSARVSQTASLDAGGKSGVKVRQFVSSAWTPWRELYHTGNVLGTVSQSGGVPTGALIERGNNANGSYVRYADGTQECWARTLPQALGEAMRWDFPVAFSSPPTTIFTSAPSGADFPRFTVSGAPTPSAVAYRTYMETGANTATECNGHAIGSWI